MHQMLNFLKSKALEGLLVFVAAGLLYVWQISLSVSSVVLIVLIGLLVFYDHEVVPRLGGYAKERLAEAALEIVALAVVATALVLWDVDVVTGAVLFLSVLGVIVTLNNRYLLRGIFKGVRDIRSHPLSAIFLIVVLILMLIWQVSFESIFFLLLFLSFLLYRWESRVIATAALVSLAVCPVLLTMGSDVTNLWAEQMAVYAYYFLVITVVLQIIEYKRHPDEYAEEYQE